MILNKANLAGLTSPGQQSEMKSILAGTWPPLKPLPVFKYETAEYRATIDFDKKRGEWVCRKTSLPSNEVQELRGGLREITLALPHGEATTFAEEVTEQQEQELEKDTLRRLQATREWREKYENGARYFELRDLLSEAQRTELDDSLRLSLTARQLQFNAKNAANVFDDLSVAGGRFAALIEFAARSKTKQGTGTSAPEETTLQGPEFAIDHDERSLESSPREAEEAPHKTEPANDDAFVQDQAAAESWVGADEFPALSIKDVFPELDKPSLPERMPRFASQQFEIETPQMFEEDSASLVDNSLEHPQQESRHSYEEGHDAPVFPSFAAQVPAGPLLADHLAGSASRFPLRISAFQVNVFAILFLFAATAFTVGLTVGRGPVGRRLREPPQSMLAKDATSLTPPDQPDQAGESSSRTTPPVASSNDSAGAKGLGDSTPSEENSRESPQGTRPADLSSPDSESSPAAEAKPSVEPEIVRPELVKPGVDPDRDGGIRPLVRNTLPPPSSKLGRRPKAFSSSVRSARNAPRNHARYGLTSAIGPAPHVARPSTILVTVPDQVSQAFRVSFPNKTIAATSSLAMTSQLSVLVSPEARLTWTRKPARLEAGELVSFGWPRYPMPVGRYGLAETIRVRATIGHLGQVQEVKFLGGSASLLPATTEAIRQWRYTPTLLDKRPVQAQQDIAIEFRPPQYSSQLTVQHPSHN